MTQKNHDASREVADRLLGPSELSEMVGVPVGTIYQWSSRGTGPRAIRVGRHLRWRRSEVERWLDEQTADRPEAS